jgi:peptidoglycan/LPS O-acetylase OafA/YrhL
MSITKRRYISELDSLRFFAFLLVFIHNSPEYSLGPFWQLIHDYGWIGVDLFFCISAYVITKTLITEHHQNGTINVKSFYVRRILRITPLYFFYLFISIYFIIQIQGWNPVLLLHTAGILVFLYNITYIFLTYKIYIVFIHLWSISYEMQFYLVIPHIISKFQAWKTKNKYIFLLIVFLIGELTRALFILYKIKHPAIYMLPITHFEALLGGFLLGTGIFDKYLGRVNKWIMLSIGFISLAIVFLLPNTYVINWHLMLTYPASGIGTTLIIFFVIDSSKKNINQTSNFRPTQYLGTISYGLYMYHLLVIWLFHYILDLYKKNLEFQPNEYPLILVIISLLITIVISSASFHWLEKPFLKLKMKY